ncbi:hypothetical protein ACVILL_004420 [Bradyrhizobium sp. USDA 3364]
MRGLWIAQRCHRHVTKPGYAFARVRSGPPSQIFAPSGPRQSPRLTGTAFFVTSSRTIRWKLSEGDDGNRPDDEGLVICVVPAKAWTHNHKSS